MYLDRLYGKPKQVIEQKTNLTLEDSKAVDTLNSLLNAKDNG